MITDRLSRASDIAPESGSKTLDSKVQNSLPPARLVQTVIGALAIRDTATSLTGDTIVLWPSILANYQIYQVPIEAWIGRHRLVVIDGPGHGDSGPAPEPFTMKQCGQAMSEILDELGVSTPAIIIGCSWGGLVAGEFAIDYPSRTKAVVMLNTPIHNKKSGLKLSDRFVVWGARWLHKSRVYQDGVARSFFLQKTCEQGGPMMDAFRQHLQRANGAALARSVRSVMLERGVGVGWVQEIDFDLNSGATERAWSKQGKVAFQLIGGVEVPLNNLWSVVADARIMRVGSIELPAEEGVTGRLSRPSYNPISVQLGLRRMF
jgi:pimeloyl-ACP methyl ester carboxylesterase